jgi:hypothetical protein
VRCRVELRQRLHACARRRVDAERLEDVARITDQRRAVAQERETAGHLHAIDVAGERHHRDTQVGGVRGGVERPAARRGFDDDDAVGKACDDRVAFEELPRLGGALGRVRRDDGSAPGHDPLRQRTVGPGEEMLVAAAEDADRRRAGRERALVRRGVDTEREPADDADARGADQARRLVRQPPPPGAGRARPDDRDDRAGERIEPPAHPQGGLEAGAAGPQAQPGLLSRHGEPRSFHLPRSRTAARPQDQEEGATREYGWANCGRGPSGRTKRLPSEVERHGCGSVLREMQDEARDQRRGADHDEERQAGDGGEVPGLRDQDVQDRSGQVGRFAPVCPQNGSCSILD